MNTLIQSIQTYGLKVLFTSLFLFTIGFSNASNIVDAVGIQMNEAPYTAFAALDSITTSNSAYNQEVDVLEKPVVDYPKYRIAASVGYSYRIARVNKDVDPQFHDYVRDLKSGMALSFDGTYYFSRVLGAGFKYAKYQSSNSIHVRFDNGQRGVASDNISIDFYGPFLGIRLPIRNSESTFVINYGIGYLGYKDKFVLMTPGTYKGSTVSSFCDFSYDLMVMPQLALGLQMSYYGGIINRFERTYQGTTTTEKFETGKGENLYRFDFSLGVRYSF